MSNPPNPILIIKVFALEGSSVDAADHKIHHLENTKLQMSRACFVFGKVSA